MKISLKTLANFCDLSEFSHDEISKMITSAGIEVASIKNQVVASNVEVGQIISIEKHPNADNLNVCQVQLSDGISQIVCGAKNVRVNQKVVVAKPGAVLYDNFKIKKSVIRDVESNGMICSLSEIGVAANYLSESQLAGIEELDNDTIIGSDPIIALDLDDATLELDLTPNRADCLGIFDFAYEASAIFKKEMTLPKIVDLSTSPTSINLEIDSKLSSRFIAFKVSHLKVCESPTFLKHRLMAMGVKSVNNIVDIANYVMLITGQPIHTYDAKKLHNGHLQVAITNGDTFEGLDGNQYLTKNDIGIFSGQELVGLAGIMGSENSKIDDNTTEIVVEIATFDSPSIRSTSKRLNLFTDASTRFVKGVNEDNTELVISLIHSLLSEYATSNDPIDIEKPNQVIYQQFESNQIIVTLKEINETLMLELTESDVSDIFSRLNFTFESKDATFIVNTLARRKDIELPCDLIEEVARLYGYDHLLAVLPNVQSTDIEPNLSYQKISKIRHLLTHLGLYEAVNYSLVTNKEANLISFEDTLSLLKETGREKDTMRQSLLTSLMDNIKHNHAYSQYNVRLFEISDVYGFKSSKKLLSGVLSGEYHTNHWQQINKKVDFFVVKGIIENIMSLLGLDSRLQFKAGVDIEGIFHDYQCATILIDYKPVGVIGRLHPLFESKYDAKDVYGFEIDLGHILNVKSSKIKCKTISRYQSVQRDLSLLVNQNVLSQDIVTIVNKAANKLAVNVHIFDVYQNEELSNQGLQSMGIAITLQSNDHTLTENEINSTMSSVIDALKKSDITIRGL